MRRLSEGLEIGDLEHLVSNKLHFDEYDSKMGEPDDVITVSFKVRDEMPAKDLVSFIENGYDWVLDADISEGEIGEGERLVFVETQRRTGLFDKLLEMLEDLKHLTKIEPNDWKFRWYKQREDLPLTKENIERMIPDSPHKYREFLEGFQQVMADKDDLGQELERLRQLSGIK
jgi:hypothetical protein